MDILTRYQCQHCKTQYADRDTALKCELGHKQPVGIKAAHYHSFNNDATGYPITVDVKMKDGSTVRYQRVRRL